MKLNNINAWLSNNIFWGILAMIVLCISVGVLPLRKQLLLWIDFIVLAIYTCFIWVMYKVLNRITINHISVIGDK